MLSLFRNRDSIYLSLRTFGFVTVDTVAMQSGLNAKLNEMHAAMTLASLDDVQEQVARNKKRYDIYKSELESVPGIGLLEFDEKYKAGYKNIVCELLDNWPLSRESTIEILNAENILARAYYYTVTPQVNEVSICARQPGCYRSVIRKVCQHAVRATRNN